MRLARQYQTYKSSPENIKGWTHFHCSLGPHHQQADFFNGNPHKHKCALFEAAKPASNDHAIPTQAFNDVTLRLAPLVLLPPRSNATTQLTRRTQQLLTRRVRSPQPHEHVQGHQTTASSSSQQPCRRNRKVRRTSQKSQLLGIHAELAAKK
jgi:hypothetical protein